MLSWIKNNWGGLLSIYISYAVIWASSWYLSVNFETLSNIASLFLPAGIRVSALILLPIRFWPAIVLAEYSAMVYIYGNEFLKGFYSLGEFIRFMLPVLTCMPFIILLKRSTGSLELGSVKHVFALMKWLLLSQVMTAIIMVTGSLQTGHIEQPFVVTALLSYVFGDMVGISIILPFVYIIHQMLNRSISIETKDVLQFLFASTVFITALTFLLLYYPALSYYVKLMALLPIIYAAIKHGWLGASATNFSVLIFILISEYISTSFDSVLESQLFMTITTIVSLLLGAAMTELNKSNRRLVEQNQEQIKINNELVMQMGKNQRLAKKLVDVQENERKSLSMELHDEIGQNITALKLNISAAKNINTDNHVESILNSIHEIAERTYDSAYDLMHSLRPRIIDELGIEEAIKSFRQVLARADINYNLNIDGDLKAIDEPLKIATYRILQEVVNNTIKHSGCRELEVMLRLDERYLILSFRDDGEGFDTSVQRDGFGIQGIDDRAAAFGGGLAIESSGAGTLINVKLPLFQ
jgi:two-component system sensor histidine kinase UhpB